MEKSKKLIALRTYCRQNDWPRLPQWQHWIYSRNPIALECIKKIGNRYLIDLEAWDSFIQKSTLND